MDAIWHDEFGADIRLADALHKRPSVLIFADFTCSTLCGSIVSVAAELLTHTGLQPGRDFALVVLGLDAKDGVAEALVFKQQIADRAVASATKVLSASEVRVKQAAEAVGYRSLTTPTATSTPILRPSICRSRCQLRLPNLSSSPSSSWSCANGLDS
jgi:protein SCO1/2